MSLVATEPQPALAWSFESSNVDYVTNLAPTTTLGTPTYVAGKYGSASNYIGNMYEIAIFSTTLSDADRLALEN